MASGAVRPLLEGHAATLAAVTAAPDALVLAAAAHCAAMSPPPEHSTQATASPLRLDEWHLSPPFRWSPLPVRRALGAWARATAEAQFSCALCFRSWPFGYEEHPGLKSLLRYQSEAARAWVCAAARALPAEEEAEEEEEEEEAEEEEEESASEESASEEEEVSASEEEEEGA